uniref:Retrotransposon gag domain-containing protein n=1 Tax=Knipowitschia caucasica TaxID=637954 RepID=A0AAV2LUH3_KNICA
MWNGEESPFKPKYEAEERFPVRNVRVDLPPLFAGDGSQSFLGWVRQLEVAIQATVGTGSDCDEELSAFLLWDSLPDRVKHDYSAVKEKLAGAFGQRQFMDRFRATLSARPRAAGESLEVYAADVSRLVAEAFPDNGVVARKEEKFRRFLASLDPALKSKCLEQGATDLEEAPKDAKTLERRYRGTV